jgi:hypothetical protein
MLYGEEGTRPTRVESSGKLIRLREDKVVTLPVECILWCILIDEVWNPESELEGIVAGNIRWFCCCSSGRYRSQQSLVPLRVKD